MSAKSLKQYAKEKSNFISIDSGDSYTAIYRGYKFIEKDSFGETKEYARYALEDLEDKRTRNFDSMSAALAERMAEVKVGTTITIAREGEGMSTKYKISGEGVPEKKEIPTIEEDEEIDQVNAEIAGAPKEEADTGEEDKIPF